MGARVKALCEEKRTREAVLLRERVAKIQVHVCVHVCVCTCACVCARVHVCVCVPQSLYYIAYEFPERLRHVSGTDDIRGICLMIYVVYVMDNGYGWCI